MSEIKTFFKEESPGRVIEYLMQLLFESPPERFPSEDEVLDWTEILYAREDSKDLLQAILLCESFVVPLEDDETLEELEDHFNYFEDRFPQDIYE